MSFSNANVYKSNELSGGAMRKTKSIFRMLVLISVMHCLFSEVQAKSESADQLTETIYYRGYNRPTAGVATGGCRIGGVSSIHSVRELELDVGKKLLQQKVKEEGLFSRFEGSDPIVRLTLGGFRRHRMKIQFLRSSGSLSVDESIANYIQRASPFEIHTWSEITFLVEFPHMRVKPELSLNL